MIIVCGIEKDRASTRCPRCKHPHRLDRKGRVPVRRCEGVAITWNDLEALGPCIHRGELLRSEPCQFCGQRQKLVPIYACHSPNAPAAEISEARWRHAQPRSETCGGCGEYEPAP